jgi:hypothetical protein
MGHVFLDWDGRSRFGKKHTEDGRVSTMVEMILECRKIKNKNGGYVTTLQVRRWNCLCDGMIR